MTYFGHGAAPHWALATGLILRQSAPLDLNLEGAWAGLNRGVLRRETFSLGGNR